MNKRLLIIGAGGFGREVYQWAKHVNLDNGQWDEILFLDKDQNALDDFNMSHLLIGFEDEFEFTERDFVVCAIGEPVVKGNVYNKMLSRGVKIANLIHPTVVIGDNVQLGNGLILCPGVVITTNVFIGNYVIINCLSGVGHDVVISDGCTINGNCDITGKVSLGCGVFVGSGATVLPGIAVGDHSIIGAGSVVVNTVKPNTTVFGNPAKRIF